MPPLRILLAGPVLVAGLCLSGAAPGQPVGAVSPRVADLTLGLFCAPPEGDRRPAPDTMAGWVHVPDQPVEMIAEGNAAPAVLGLGFGVRFRLADGAPAITCYSVTHPPMPPSGITTQRWEGAIGAGATDTVFFQFDTPEELQPGDWTFSATADGEVLFTVAFTVTAPAALPDLARLCQGGALFSLSRGTPAAAG